jgi:hypothetical protein
MGVQKIDVNKMTCMPKRDGGAFQLAAKTYFEKAFHLALLTEVLITLDTGTKLIQHHVDLATKDKSTLIECKSYTFRPGGGDPVNKLSQAEKEENEENHTEKAHVCRLLPSALCLLLSGFHSRPRTG